MSASGAAHRALKLSPFASATFDNVLNTNISVAEMISAPSRRAARSSISTAVAIEAITISIGMATGKCGSIAGRKGAAGFPCRAGR